MEYKQKNDNALVDMIDIHKYFGSVQVLRGIDFHVDRQEIVGLLGDNGAGKSTLIKVLTGYHSLTRGQIFFDDEAVRYPFAPTTRASWALKRCIRIWRWFR